MKRRHSMTGRACSWLRATPCVLTIALVGVGYSPRAAMGQSAVWLPNGATSGNIYYNGGNVGIGTGPSPASPLEVNGFLRTTGATGFAASGASLDIAYNPAYPAGTGGGRIFAYDHTAGAYKPIAIGINNGSQLFLTSTGNVGIGTASPGTFKLAVEGNIGARDVMVTNVTPWPDYVLQPEYRLRPLSEVHEFIQAHHHLPDIPSEAEVKAQGVSVGEMQSKLLAKVEELTLHMIRQEKENQALRERIAQLELRSSGNTAVR
jgi:hypothetical protein